MDANQLMRSRIQLFKIQSEDCDLMIDVPLDKVQNLYLRMVRRSIINCTTHLNLFVAEVAKCDRVRCAFERNEEQYKLMIVKAVSKQNEFRDILLAPVPNTLDEWEAMFRQLKLVYQFQVHLLLKLDEVLVDPPTNLPLEGA